MTGLASLLPTLAAGFLFIIIFYETRLTFSKWNGQRLILMSGVIGLASSTFAQFILASSKWLNSLFDPFNNLITAIHSVMTVATGVILALTTNLLYVLAYRLVARRKIKHYASNTWEWVISRRKRKTGNAFERMLMQVSDSNGERLILVSMKSRKVYCGAVRKLSPQQGLGEEFVEVIPMFSATRNKDTLRFEEKINYPAFHLWRLKRRMDILKSTLESDRDSLNEDQHRAAKIEYEGIEADYNIFAQRAPIGYAENLDINLWSKAIPINEIESLSLYDEDDNNLWFSSDQNQQQNNWITQYSNFCNSNWSYTIPVYKRTVGAQIVSIPIPYKAFHW